MAQFKDRLLIVENAVHATLAPLGFKKQKSNWRRLLPEIIQQFTIASEQLNARYRPEWGLTLLSRSENPKPFHGDLHVRWSIEPFISPNIIGTGHDPLLLATMLEMKRAFQLARPTSDRERISNIDKLLLRYVMPCFDMYQTEQSVHEMMGRHNAPLRAQMFGGCPNEWWPKD